ncbi:hypothetical protein DMENIID0001_145910 [Sergentomyia squamirostris]
MSEVSGGGQPPGQFNLNNSILRNDMPTLTESTSKLKKSSLRALKHAYFTHPSEEEKYYVLSGEEIRKIDAFDIDDGLQLICPDGFKSVTRLASGDVLVKTKSSKQIDSLKCCSTFGKEANPVSVSENGALNQSQALVRPRLVLNVSTEKYAKNLPVRVLWLFSDE